MSHKITNANQCNDWAKDLCNCNYLKECKHNNPIPRMETTELPSPENYKGEAYYKQYTGELLDIFYYRFYEGHGHLSDVPENLKREAFYEWLNEQIKNTTF